MLIRKLKILIIIGILSVCAFIFQNCESEHRQSNGPSNDSSPSTDTNSGGGYDWADNKATYDPQKMAVILYRRLAGITLPIDDPTIQEMKTLIEADQVRDAATIATNSNEFYSITVRNFAGKMSDRSGSTHAPMSDFVATVIGSVRDGINAIELMTENYFYRVRGVSGVGDNLMNDIILSNNHYDSIDSESVDLIQNLEREDGQKIRTEGGAVDVHPDASGILTTRAFMEAHASGGTNRRIIEYIFKIFLCTPIDKWANGRAPDDRVGRDIGRNPISSYTNKCKGCHTGMDAMRPATAYYDFILNDNNTGFLAYKYKNPMDPREDDADILDVPVPEDEQNVPFKFRRTASAFPAGFKVKDDSWRNYADSDVFGWEAGGNSGNGMRDLGYFIANSKGFRQCMVKRVFKSVCSTDLTTDDSTLIDKLAHQFQSNNHDLKDLFINIATRPECIGDGQ